jgi:hypothetical protein
VIDDTKKLLRLLANSGGMGSVSRYERSRAPRSLPSRRCSSEV